jgi:hypothetical protein
MPLIKPLGHTGPVTGLTLLYYFTADRKVDRIGKVGGKYTAWGRSYTNDENVF